MAVVRGCPDGTLPVDFHALPIVVGLQSDGLDAGMVRRSPLFGYSSDGTGISEPYHLATSFSTHRSSENLGSENLSRGAGCGFGSAGLCFDGMQSGPDAGFQRRLVFGILADSICRRGDPLDAVCAIDSWGRGSEFGIRLGNRGGAESVVVFNFHVCDDGADRGEGVVYLLGMLRFCDALAGTSTSAALGSCRK